MQRYLIGTLILVSFCINQKLQAAPAPDEHYSEFFLISEEPEKASVDPIQLMATHLENIISQINLTSWELVNRPLPTPTEKYDRKKHFGTWIRDPRDKSNCLTTRAKVLIRDSKTQVQMSPNNCTVKQGSWYDPSVNQTFTDAQFMEIDHFVPLKNVYISGGWQWSPEMRCLYANFMGNPMHLVPFNRTENRAKADNTPERYMPPEKSYRCEYLYKWLTVKAIWKVALNPNEATAINNYLKSENCNIQNFSVDTDFVKQQRRWMADNLSMCQKLVHEQAQ